MSRRPFAAVLLMLPLVAARPGAAQVPTAPAPARVVVQNDTYSSLMIAIVDGSGRESALGQAPPEFSNTLIVKEPLPEGSVRLVARLAGESEVLYRSDEVRLRPGTRIRWRLPDNRIEH
ncbi:MAG TPA: hypothetical protein VF212_10520 [Longimicrobiales bacterium]